VPWVRLLPKFLPPLGREAGVDRGAGVDTCGAVVCLTGGAGANGVILGAGITRSSAGGCGGTGGLEAVLHGEPGLSWPDDHSPHSPTPQNPDGGHAEPYMHTSAILLPGTFCAFKQQQVLCTVLFQLEGTRRYVMGTDGIVLKGCISHALIDECSFTYLLSQACCCFCWSFLGLEIQLVLWINGKEVSNKQCGEETHVRASAQADRLGAIRAAPGCVAVASALEAVAVAITVIESTTCQ
jgi:hypothetical protein